MDEHIHCPCGWTGPRAMLRAGSCPTCMRPAGVPYGYAPLESWKRPKSPVPERLTPIPVTMPHARYQCCGSSRVGSTILFMVLITASVVALNTMLTGRTSCRIPKQQRTEVYVEKKPALRDQVVISPEAKPDVPSRYGEAPKVRPVPDKRTYAGRYASAHPEPDAPRKPAQSAQKETGK